MGKLIKVILVFIVIISVLIAGKNFIVKSAIVKSVKMAVDLPLEIKKLDIGIFSSHIGITDLSLLNPSGFPKGVMFHVSEIFVDYYLGDMLKGKLHFEEMRLNFDQLVIIKNADGKMNLEALKPKAKDGSKKPAKEKTSIKAKKGMPKIQIDHLVLKV